MALDSPKLPTPVERKKQPVVLQYEGRLTIRPLDRGTVLEDLEGQPGIEDYLEPGDYTARLIILPLAE